MNTIKIKYRIVNCGTEFNNYVPQRRTWWGGWRDIAPSSSLYNAQTVIQLDAKVNSDWRNCVLFIHNDVVSVFDKWGRAIYS